MRWIRLPGPASLLLSLEARELHKCCVGAQRRRVVREAAFDASGSCASILRNVF